jgi:hypothetical protein
LALRPAANSLETTIAVTVCDLYSILIVGCVASHATERTVPSER